MWRERSQDSLASIHFCRGDLGTRYSDTTNHGRIASPNPYPDANLGHIRASKYLN